MLGFLTILGTLLGLGQQARAARDARKAAAEAKAEQERANKISAAALTDPADSDQARSGGSAALQRGGALPAQRSAHQAAAQLVISRCLAADSREDAAGGSSWIARQY
jgi:hypothetical protein